ncbi:MAG: 2-(1,2-epoxy-1,2-dihydrophenyl)acetyl-CoA isomerase [Gammaproteobacteria bacterium]|jgi:2-(1,2-epoxy-1,2-dihydrophenyl)acetyl-CoA isomerase
MSFEHIDFAVENGVAVLTLDRPDAANALNLQLSKELMDVSIECDENPDVRVLVIRANGKMFCAGGDLKSFATQGERLGHGLKDLTIYLHGAISRFSRMNAPVITEVHGMAAGAGMSLAICADFVMAAESAGFTMAYTAAALSPDGSSTFFLPRLVGLQRAKELMITNRRLTAAEAADWGIVSRVIPDENLRQEVDALAQQLSVGPTAAFGSVKRLLDTTFSNGLETQMELEAREIVNNAKGLDGREGIDAFVNKRKPSYVGKC